MALQLSAIETSDGIGLQFTKVLDTVRLGYLDEDEEVAETTGKQNAGRQTQLNSLTQSLK